MNMIKKLDLISRIPSARLSFGKDSDHKTVVGGCCTLIAIAGFLLVVIVSALQIIYIDQPYISSIEKPFEYNDPDTGEPWKMNIKDGYKLLFGVEGWNNKYELDKSKIHAYIQHYKWEGLNP